MSILHPIRQDFVWIVTAFTATTTGRRVYLRLGDRQADGSDLVAQKQHRAIVSPVKNSVDSNYFTS